METPGQRVKWSGRTADHRERLPCFKGSSIELGDAANFDTGESFSVSAWINVPENLTSNATVVGRLDDTNGQQGWKLFVQGKSFGLQIVAKNPNGFIRVMANGTPVVPGNGTISPQCTTARASPAVCVFSSKDARKR